MRRIATEEAFATPEQFEAMTTTCCTTWDSLDFVLWRQLTDRGKPSVLRDRLLDVDQERLKIMDELEVAMHVLSLTSPGVQMFDADTATAVAQRANDRLAEVTAGQTMLFARHAA